MSRPDAQVSTRVLTRLVVVLVALWSTFAGLVLLAFHGAASGALGAGVSDEAGQRLLGAHLLVLVPAYLLIAWQPERYFAFLWLPFAAQLAASLVVAYSIVRGETEFGDGVLPVAVGVIFVVLLGYLWLNEQRALAREQMEDAEGETEADAVAQADTPGGSWAAAGSEVPTDEPR